MRNLILSLILLGSSLCYAGNDDDFATVDLDEFHLEEITQQSDKVFTPIGVEILKPTPEQRETGVRNRLIISYAQIAFEDFETTFRSNNQERGAYGNFDINKFNEIMKEKMKLNESHIVSIEYFVTDQFSIELSDTYRDQGFDRTQVGEIDMTSAGAGLLGGGTTSSQPYYMDHNSKTHDFNVGLGYTLKLINKSWGGLELTLKGNAGIIHLDTRTEVDYGTNDNYTYEYEGLAGYSLGAGVRTRFTYKNFFVQGGVDYKNYVIAPMEHQDGSTSDINQKGLMYYLGIGIKF
ncbi:MAG: hypothetical protein ACJAT2_002530 [Bacteriovoracaceae bacterium]|jgi:hypothetical protein